MPYYSRKSPRIPNYDYSQENYYFITICTKERKCLFGSIHNKNWIGRMAEEHILCIPEHFTNVVVDTYVVMPNHVHMILVLKTSGESNTEQIIGQYKSGLSREVRKRFPDIQIWQRSFHDHIIRNQKAYETIWLYIASNPDNWKKDCFYVEQN